MRMAILAILLLNVWTVNATAWAQDCVPGKREFRQPVTSPDGLYRVSKVFCSDQAHEGELVLELRNLKSGEDRTVYTYNRDATVLWSPDSRWLFVAARGDLDAVSQRTGQITNLSHTLGPALPQLFQLSM